MTRLMTACCTLYFLLVPAPTRAQIIANPDVSATASAAIERPSVSRGFSKAGTTVTIDFNDLLADEVVDPNRYSEQGVQIQAGPNGSSGIIKAHTNTGPCDETRSIETVPFVGPSFLFRFPNGVRNVTLSSGDIGPSDTDTITLTAYEDDALTNVVGSTTVILDGSAPTSCVELSVGADLIMAAEVTSTFRFQNSVMVDNLTFTPLSDRQIKLEKRGRTVIEPGNNYSENTTLRATVVFAPDHPRAGHTDRDFNEPITFRELYGTAHYDGLNGATAMPVVVQASRGVAEIEIKSVSDSQVVRGPMDALILAEAVDLNQDADSNPIGVEQWVDEDGDEFIDWLAESSKDIHDCARRQHGEVKTVESKVSRIEQDTKEDQLRCGFVVVQLVNRSAIRISPICGIPNRHRLNLINKLSGTVLHEARHAWQNSARNRKVGTNDDGLGETPRNDDDLDYLLEMVEFSSANVITEAASGTGDDRPDPNGLAQWEVDAADYGDIRKFVCP